MSLLGFLTNSDWVIWSWCAVHGCWHTILFCQSDNKNDDDNYYRDPKVEEAAKKELEEEEAELAAAEEEVKVEPES